MNAPPRTPPIGGAESQLLKDARLILALAGLSMKEARRIRGSLGTEEAIWEAKWQNLVEAGVSKKAARRIINIVTEKEYIREAEELEKRGAEIKTFGFPGYPKRLVEIPSAPCALFCLGLLPDDEKPALAMIGSRRATTEGLRLARLFGGEMAEVGIQVISGMARGIDSAAISGCLRRDGSGVGVLGCGIDRIYPPENRRLFQETLRRGALVSEFPLGTPPHKKNFPRRNRIISGLSHGVLVVAATEKSGSLITVDHALAQNRFVMAMPGPVGINEFKGSNTLIRDGALIVLEPEDILAALYIHRPKARPSSSRRPACPENPAEKILEACRYEACTIETLASKTGLPVDEVLVLASRLELDGRLQRVPGARFILR